MFLRENPYAAILYLTAVMSGCVALTAWTRREIAPATRPFTWLMVAIALYAATAALGASTFSLQSRIFWATCEYAASNSVIALYLTFTLNFTGRVRWMRFRRRLLIWTLPSINVLLVATNHWHHLIWTSFIPHSDKAHIIFQHGAGFYWIATNFYIYVITGSLLVARNTIQASNLYRQQSFVVLASAVPPLVGGSIYVFRLLPPYINLLPMSFLLTGCIYFNSLFRDRLFDLVPIARDIIIEEMSEGIIVIDEANRIVDINRAAKQHVVPTASRQTSAIGQSIEIFLGHWPELAQHCQSLDDRACMIVSAPQLESYLEIRATYLHSHHQHARVKVIILRDITQEQRDRLEIQRANAELTRQLEANQTLRDQLEEQATKDGLTQLFNRRYLETFLPAEFDKARRSQQPLSVLLLDIDYFKQINDTYGHLAGDFALRSFAQIIQQRIRKTDVACRYGGEEFVVALPNTSIEEACKKADDIRRAFKTTLLAFEGNSFNATISIGVGAVPDPSGIYTLTHPDHLLQQVDKALYQAKRNGRDRIETTTPNNPYALRQLRLEKAIREYQDTHS